MGNYYAPWYVILWRALWFIPWQISRCLYVGIVFCMFGASSSKDAWYDT